MLYRRFCGRGKLALKGVGDAIPEILRTREACAEGSGRCYTGNLGRYHCTSARHGSVFTSQIILPLVSKKVRDERLISNPMNEETEAY